jgi:CRP-like cAMP-binding protein
MPSKNQEIPRPERTLKFGIGSERIEKLKKIGKTKLLPKGECLLSAGSVPDSVYILIGGLAEIVAKDADGLLLSVRSVSLGAVLGLTELMANFRCDTQVCAVTDCTFSVIAQYDLMAFLRQDPDMSLELAFAIAGMLVQRINDHGI